MSYELQAVIGAEAVLRMVAAQQPGAVVVPLRQGFALIPMTDELFDSATDGGRGDGLRFSKLPGGFERLLADWSTTGPLGYVEAGYAGGAGTQRAALWAGGELAIGPMFVDVNEPFPAIGSPISQVLAHLGATRRRRDADEFVAVGLDRCRDTEAWLAVDRSVIPDVARSRRRQGHQAPVAGTRRRTVP
ncbi:hypothetical protein [Catellatospora paridis]|uniref:hypothetical protein n=1 Tax=Catellatospora paridis TaxID=1617086 RepID=UPI0012D416DD|nr:hypothetical protein [Catellatospora paridis]